ncbi:hypothetical protein HDV05_003324 [Chytridiales sp. JEL 0842]|nr:hypothetical protein HDV05_003324 [Chytridiales sp. JEL 0842]
MTSNPTSLNLSRKRKLSIVNEPPLKRNPKPPTTQKDPPSHLSTPPPPWWTPPTAHLFWNPPTHLEGEEEGELLTAPPWTLADRLCLELGAFERWAKPTETERRVWEGLLRGYTGHVREAVREATTEEGGGEEGWGVELSFVCHSAGGLERVLDAGSSSSSRGRGKRKGGWEMLEGFRDPLVVWEDLVVVYACLVPPASRRLDQGSAIKTSLSLTKMLTAVEGRLMAAKSAIRESAKDLSVKKVNYKIRMRDQVLSILAPTVQFEDRMTKVKWEIRFSVQEDIKRGGGAVVVDGLPWFDEVAESGETFKYLVPLTRVLKQLFIGKGLETGITSYSLLLWVSSFLALHDGLYEAEKSQGSGNNSKEEGDASTPRNPDKRLGDLFLDFCHLFGKTFDYSRFGLDAGAHHFDSVLFDKTSNAPLAPDPHCLTIKEPAPFDGRLVSIGTAERSIIPCKQALADAFDTLVEPSNWVFGESLLGKVVHVRPDNATRRQRLGVVAMMMEKGGVAKEKSAVEEVLGGCSEAGGGSCAEETKADKVVSDAKAGPVGLLVGATESKAAAPAREANKPEPSVEDQVEAFQKKMAIEAKMEKFKSSAVANSAEQAAGGGLKQGAVSTKASAGAAGSLAPTGTSSVAKPQQSQSSLKAPKTATPSKSEQQLAKKATTNTNTTNKAAPAPGAPKATLPQQGRPMTTKTAKASNKPTAAQKKMNKTPPAANRASLPSGPKNQHRHQTNTTATKGNHAGSGNPSPRLIPGNRLPPDGPLDRSPVRPPFPHHPGSPMGRRGGPRGGGPQVFGNGAGRGQVPLWRGNMDPYSDPHYNSGGGYFGGYPPAGYPPPGWY